MKRAVLLILAFCAFLSAGCSGLSSVNWSRCDRGRRITHLAVIAHNQTIADRHKMWAWAKRKPQPAPRDMFAEEIINCLSKQTDCAIIPLDVTNEALRKMGLEGSSVMTRAQMREFSTLTGADAILFADVSFYLQNYLFYKTFGLVEISMRMVGAPDGNLLWSARGRNFALFITTDSSLNKVRDKMIAQLARKIESDKKAFM